MTRTAVSLVDPARRQAGLDQRIQWVVPTTLVNKMLVQAGSEDEAKERFDVVRPHYIQGIAPRLPLEIHQPERTIDNVRGYMPVALRIVWLLLASVKYQDRQALPNVVELRFDAKRLANVLYGKNYTSRQIKQVRESARAINQLWLCSIHRAEQWVRVERSKREYVFFVGYGSSKNPGPMVDRDEFMQMLNASPYLFRAWIRLVYRLNVTEYRTKLKHVRENTVILTKKELIDSMLPTGATRQHRYYVSGKLPSLVRSLREVVDVDWQDGRWRIG